MKKLALFDFDGTITHNDTLIAFIRFVKGDIAFIVGLVALSPMLLLYKLNIIPNDKAKERLLSWFFKGYDERSFKTIAKTYSLEHIDKVVRPKALERLQWHKAQNHEIVIVSASMECWLMPWCEKNGYGLLATQLAFEEGIFTGRFVSKNCYGEEKVHRLKASHYLDECDYIYAYGDSAGDKAMLSFANEGYYKKFE